MIVAVTEWSYRQRKMKQKNVMKFRLSQKARRKTRHTTQTLMILLGSLHTCPQDKIRKLGGGGGGHPHPDYVVHTKKGKVHQKPVFFGAAPPAEPCRHDTLFVLSTGLVASGLSREMPVLLLRVLFTSPDDQQQHSRTCFELLYGTPGVWRKRLVLGMGAASRKHPSCPNNPNTFCPGFTS